MSAFDIGNDSKAAQRVVILAALRRGPVSTIEARDLFGIGHPAGRCMELRKQGYPIKTEMKSAFDWKGRPHRSAVYTLLKEQP